VASGYFVCQLVSETGKTKRKSEPGGIACMLEGISRMGSRRCGEPSQNISREHANGKVRISAPEALEMTMVPRALLSTLALAPVLLTSACSVHVNKDADGEGKDVKIDTPIGGIHVNKGNVAQATGIAVYPGATLDADKKGDKGADVRLGFGRWQLRVKVASYVTPDGKEKVISYYRKALGGSGEVLECQGDKPVGSPARTNGGLTCSDHVQTSNVHSGSDSLLLKTGTKRRQRMVVLEHEKSEPEDGPTKFALISLDLPADESDRAQTD
jgi:hypothetical protein